MVICENIAKVSKAFAEHGLSGHRHFHILHDCFEIFKYSRQEVIAVCRKVQ